MVTITKFDNYTDAELLRTVDNANNSTELELVLAERLAMRNREIEDLQNEIDSHYYDSDTDADGQ